MSASSHANGERDKLAAWCAAGRSVISFAKQHNISLSTCYSWTKRDDFKAKVGRIRQRMLDRIGGTLTRNGLAAVNAMVKLAKDADSDATKLAAAKAILDKLVEIANHSEFEKRLKVLEDDAVKSPSKTGPRRADPPQED